MLKREPPPAHRAPAATAPDLNKAKLRGCTSRQTRY